MQIIESTGRRRRFNGVPVALLIAVVLLLWAPAAALVGGGLKPNQAPLIAVGNLGTAQAQTTTNPTIQDCISFNLSQPQFRWARLRRNVKVGYTSIGQPHNKLVPAYYQIMDFESWVAANPCPDEVSRQYEFAAFFQSRNPRHRDRYFMVEPYANNKFSYVDGGYNGADVFNTAGGIRVRTYPKPMYKREIYKCYPGKGVEHVQGRFRKTVYDANTHQRLVRKITKFPIKVGRAC